MFGLHLSLITVNNSHSAPSTLSITDAFKPKSSKEQFAYHAIKSVLLVSGALAGRQLGILCGYSVIQSIAAWVLGGGIAGGALASTFAAIISPVTPLLGLALGLYLSLPCADHISQLACSVFLIRNQQSLACKTLQVNDRNYCKWFFAEFFLKD
jgi:hypothetical protein